MRNDIRVTVLVGIAHALSHFLQLVITPVIPLIKSEFDLTFAAIGALMTVTYAVSGLMQFPAGMAVDRFGGRAVLVFGLTAMGLGTLMIALAPSYAWLVVASAVIGIGNSTFHPADMALLNAKVTPSYRLDCGADVRGVDCRAIRLARRDGGQCAGGAGIRDVSRHATVLGA